MSNVGSGTPNRLLNTSFIGGERRAGFVRTATGTGSQGTYSPLTPARSDGLPHRERHLRVAASPVARRASLQVAGRGGVPASGGGRVVMNVTVTNPSIASHVTVWPGGAIPTASNLNFVAGQTRPNLVTVGVSPATGQGQPPARQRIRRSHRRRRRLLRRRYRRRCERRTLLAAVALPHPRLPHRHRRGACPRGTGRTRHPSDRRAERRDRGRAERHRDQPDGRHLSRPLWPSGFRGRTPRRTSTWSAGQTVPNLVIVGIGGNREGEPLQRRRYHRPRRRRRRLVRRHHGRRRSSRRRPRRADCSTRGIGNGYVVAVERERGPRPHRCRQRPGPGRCTAVVLNVTVTNPTVAGFATLYPPGGVAPGSRVEPQLRAAARRLPNLVMVKIGPAAR